MIPLRWLVSAFVILPLAGCSQKDSRSEEARVQLRKLADELDANTSSTGRYVRGQVGLIAETDPWGTKLKVTYARGTNEELNVQSAGPDGKFSTEDDLFEQRVGVKLADAGQDIGEVAEEAASDALRDVAEGLKDRLPNFGKNNDDNVPQPAPNK